MRVIALVFHASGKIPVDKEVLKIIHKARDNIKLQDLKNMSGIPSTPGPLCTSRLFSVEKMSPIFTRCIFARDNRSINILSSF